MKAYMKDVMQLTSTGVRFIDQTQLPLCLHVAETWDYRVVIEAIRQLRVRGAPLLGISAAYGITLAARAFSHLDHSEFHNVMHRVCDEFAASRPTAANLFWAIGIMRTILDQDSSVLEIVRYIEQRALALHADDAARCDAIASFGSNIIPEACGAITHCNTGALATGGRGTAFAVLLEAHERGKRIHVYADETRPLLQGSRLTMWELQQHGIPSTLITDGTAAMLMRRGDIAVVITGADRIAANGDCANKIGTYALALAAHAHALPFYIAAPLSTVDVTLASGDAIPIENRSSEEVTRISGTSIAPAGTDVYSPAFDITPAELISGIISEAGILRPPYTDSLTAALNA